MSLWKFIIFVNPQIETFLIFRTIRNLPDWLTEIDNEQTRQKEVSSSGNLTISTNTYVYCFPATLQKKIIILVCLTILLIIVASTLVGFFGF